MTLKQQIDYEFHARYISLWCFFGVQFGEMQCRYIYISWWWDVFHNSLPRLCLASTRAVCFHTYPAGGPAAQLALPPIYAGKSFWTNGLGLSRYPSLLSSSHNLVSDIVRSRSCAMRLGGFPTLCAHSVHALLCPLLFVSIWGHLSFVLLLVLYHANKVCSKLLARYYLLLAADHRCIQCHSWHDFGGTDDQLPKTSYVESFT